MKNKTAFMFMNLQRRFALIAAILTFLATPGGVHAQGVFNGMAGGAAEGSYRGGRAAGPVGSVAGGTLGAGVGGVVGTRRVQNSF